MAVKIGEIYPNEAFVAWTEYEPTGRTTHRRWAINRSTVNIPVYDTPPVATLYDAEIYFNNPSGTFPTYGWVDSKWKNEFQYWGYLTGVANYTTSIDGKTRFVYTLRRAEDLYNQTGTKIGALSAGYEVASDDVICGNTNKHFMLITHYRNPGMAWVPASPNQAYGWVDTGAIQYGCSSNWSIDHGRN